MDLVGCPGTFVLQIELVDSLGTRVVEKRSHKGWLLLDV